MQILLAADHAGFALKEKLIPALVKRGYEVCDFTPDFQAGDDYPLVANQLARSLESEVRSPKSGGRGTRYVVRGTKGILVCGSGVGVCIAANRHKGVRAMAGHDVTEVKLAREHNDVNVLCLSGWKTKPADALKLIEVFLKTKTSPAARHERRVKQLG